VSNWCDASFEKDSRGTLKNSTSLILVNLPDKLIKSIMKIRISGHLDKNGLSEKNQHGFSEEKSCLMNKFLEKLKKYVNRADQDHLIYLNFQ